MKLDINKLLGYALGDVAHNLARDPVVEKLMQDNIKLKEKLKGAKMDSITSNRLNGHESRIAELEKQIKKLSQKTTTAKKKGKK